MKRNLLLKTWLLAAVLPLFSFLTFPKFTPTGAWKLEVKDQMGSNTHLLLFSGNYFSWTTYDSKTGAFGSTKGGSWSLSGNKIKLHYEFNTVDSTTVGNNETVKLSLKGNQLQLKGANIPSGYWKGLDQNTDSPLKGAWLFSGRKTNGEIARRPTDGPRKTMKILTGGHFQWIAFNTETKEFFGTGGGEYMAKDGKYIENIQFFSRDNNRVGSKLSFDFSVDGDDWHHSGKSSKGDPMYEIWSQRK